MGLVKLLSLSFFLVCLVNPGLTLNCYQCSSIIDANCKEPSKLKAMMCPNPATPSCLKITAFNTGSKEMEINRTCIYDSKSACQDIVQRLKLSGKYNEPQCLLCNNKDGCNGSGALHFNLNLMLASIIVLSLRKIFN